MRQFVIEITPGGSSTTLVHQSHFDDAFQAHECAIDALDGRPGKIRVRPLIELSAIEGRGRWPNELHALASDAAREGWNTAAQNAWRRDQAFVLYGQWLAATVQLEAH